MTIQSGDIHFVASAVMDDVSNGGGAPTGTLIPDGASNAVFPDISELDRAGGRVSLRKLHVTVQTTDTDTYLGCNVIVAEPPTDPGVSVTLFSTDDTFDDRDDAAARIESYLTEGPEWAGFLLGNHVTNQRIVQIFQRTTEALPDIGQTLVLVWNEGLASERIQYVRVTSTSSVTRTYTDTDGTTYQATVVSCEISDALRYDFVGTAPNKYFKRDSTATMVRDTSVADAGIYNGVSKTTTAIAIGDLVANVETVYTQLVPSAETEIPLSNRNAAGTSAAITPSATGTVSYTTQLPFNLTTVLDTGNPITPSTLTITVGSTTLSDTGGQLYDGGTVVGAVDYSGGTVSFPALAAPYTGTKTVTFKPAASPQRVQATLQRPITLESRSYNYVLTIDPPPAPGSVTVSYRANGRWYDLYDNGGGVLAGTDSSYGAGSISYSTGAVAVTLGALPDVKSSVIVSWNNAVNYINRAGAVVAAPAIQLTLPSAPIRPTSVTFTWQNGSVTKTATDNGNGVFTGDATGTIDYLTGDVTLTPTVLPAGAQEYDVVYASRPTSSASSVSIDIPARNSDATITIDLGALNITPSTVTLTWPLVTNGGSSTSISYVQTTVTFPTTDYAKDDGNGHLITSAGRNAGTINYATGIATFQPDGNVTATLTQARLNSDQTWGIWGLASA